MRTNIRINLEKEIIPVLRKFAKGSILEIGCGNLSYRKYIKSKNYKTLDINPKVKPDFCEDIHKTKIPSNSFDTIIMIETLEHLYNPFKAIEQAHRILKQGGYVIATTPFIYPYHGEPHDYYRYTKYGLMEIFKKFQKIKITEYGNVFGATIDILTSYKIFKPLKLLNILINSLIFNNFDNKTPTGILILAKK
jgi:SAM-dependent methyltransferase